MATVFISLLDISPASIQVSLLPLDNSISGPYNLCSSTGDRPCDACSLRHRLLRAASIRDPDQLLPRAHHDSDGDATPSDNQGGSVGDYKMPWCAAAGSIFDLKGEDQGEALESDLWEFTLLVRRWRSKACLIAEIEDEEHPSDLLPQQ